MCRSCAERPTHGKRCPGQSDPDRRRLANVRQRLGRYDRAARAAAERGDYAAVEHYVDLLDRDTAEHDALTAAADREPADAVSETWAPEFTPERTADWSDEDLAAALGQLGDDPAAQDQILETLQWRDDVAAAWAADAAEYADQQRHDRDAAERAWSWEQENAGDEHASPLTNPAQRAHRALNADQQCREEYDAHTLCAYLQADSDCRGQLLTREAEAAGIDAHSLFSGPAARVRKWATPELRQWFARNGRCTWAEWRWQWFGRESDRATAATAREQSVGEAAL